MWMVLTHWTVSFIRQHQNVADVTERDVAGVMVNLFKEWRAENHHERERRYKYDDEIALFNCNYC